MDAYDHDVGRFDRAPLELHEDLTDLALALAVDFSTGTRQLEALKAAPPHKADPVSSLGRPTSSPTVPGPVSSLGHVVPPGGASASFSIINNEHPSGRSTRLSSRRNGRRRPLARQQPSSGDGAPKTKYGDKAEAGWEPATVTRGAVPLFERPGGSRFLCDNNCQRSVSLLFRKVS